MNNVSYIKTEDLKKMRDLLKYKKKVVALSLLNIGVNVGLRISDLVRLRFEDITSDNLIYLREKKTNKSKIIKLNIACIQAINELEKYYKKEGYPNYNKGFLFKSQQPQLKVSFEDSHIKECSVYRNLNELKDLLNISYPIGTHSLRKTWGYNAYKKNKDIAKVMRALNHSSPTITLRYIGVEQEDINDLYDDIII